MRFLEIYFRFFMISYLAVFIASLLLGSWNIGRKLRERGEKLKYALALSFLIVVYTWATSLL